jgi:hypothetical protein
VAADTRVTDRARWPAAKVVSARASKQHGARPFVGEHFVDAHRGPGRVGIEQIALLIVLNTRDRNDA